MKKTIFAALAVVAIAGCSKESENTQIELSNDAATFTSVVTRVSGVEWESDDEVGIIVTNATGTDIADNATYKYNALYNVTPSATNAEEGEFTADSELDKFYYPVDGTNIQFYAYYPHSTSVTSTNESYPINVAVQSSPKLIDFMEAWTTSGYNKDSDDVELAFRRRMTKLTFTVVEGAGVDLDDITSISLEGFYTTADYSLATNSFSNFGDVKSIKPYREDDNYPNIYCAILIPTHDGTTAVTAHSTPKVKFVEGGETFYWDLAGETLKAGENNSYNVKISRTGVTTTGEIQPWTPVDKDDVSAE